MVMTGAERVAKNYEKNKESILAKKRERYHANKAKKLAKVESELPTESVLVEIPLKESELPNTSELIEVEELIDPTNVLEIITKNINSLEGETDGNKKIRISNMKSIINILNPVNYKEFIKALKTRPINTIKQIKQFQYRPNKTYAPNTLIALYKAVLFYFEKFNLKIKQTNKEKYEDAIQIYDAIAIVELKEKNKTTIPTFDEYLQRVLDEFGIYSREHIIVKLYQQVKCRDDLLLIVADSSTQLDKNVNYLIVGEIFKVVLNDYKTIDRYGVVDVELDTELTTLLEHYMENHNIKIDDSLFNSNNISKIISRVNQKLGYVGWGAINLIRKMLASDTSVLPIETQVKVARQMCHSLKVTNSNYVVKECP
tara:strand:+ start:121 stop:1230 length:1110 start_codon:yes stop_codon:yes gene_type:complete